MAGGRVGLGTTAADVSEDRGGGPGPIGCGPDGIAQGTVQTNGGGRPEHVPLIDGTTGAGNQLYWPNQEATGGGAGGG